MGEAKKESRMKVAIPYVWVANVPAAVPWYRDRLGFEVEFTHAWEYDDHEYGMAILARDDVQIHLRVCECGDFRHTGTAFYQIQVEDIDTLYEEVIERGANLRFEIETKEWGIRDFQVEDPEGNRIYFFEHVDL